MEIKRQAMSVTIKQLRKIADNFFYELLENCPKGLYKSPKDILAQKVSVPIVNKTPEQNDTWEIED